MKAIKKRYVDVLGRLITRKFSPEEFKHAFKPGREEIKTLICFK